ncbi:MAG: tRNA pseudouridine(55) synthase TruB [Chloracidobacterium sp.]|nr:tRNA pseudouridine(55) synthase TruB [Chloracidobacterium sp.]
MDGILVIDKPEGITSHDVVNRVRRILRIKRVGHTGTLDPFATGVMVILIGRATRLARFLDKDEKEYEARVQFGSETETGDLTGQVIAGCGLQTEELERKVSEIDWNEIFAQFRGDSMQVPPMYSAKKVDGRKLYELARAGEEVERKAVPVSIRKIELINDDHSPRSAIRVRVACSAGTYIRTLAEDIGKAAGLGAHLTELRRTRAGKFRIEDAVTLDELEAMDDRLGRLVSMNDALGHLPEVELSEDRAVKTKNGLSSRIAGLDLADGTLVRMTDGDETLIAVGEFAADENSVRPVVVLG